MIISIFILLIVIYAFVRVRGVNHNLLKLILLVTGINVFLTELLIAYSINIRLNTNLYFILNNFLWIQILLQHFRRRNKTIINFGLIIFIALSLYTNSIISDVFYTYFTLTSLLYIALFFLISTKYLKNENITFFQSLDFILIFAPVLFFLGMSFIFGFKSDVFSKTYILEGVNVYRFINFIVNMVYYWLIAYYVFKSKKQ